MDDGRVRPCNAPLLATLIGQPARARINFKAAAWSVDYDAG
jgi:hypothetical protein